MSEETATSSPERLPPTVLLHGFTGGPDSFDGVLPHLRGPIATLTLPGHRHTPAPQSLEDALAIVDTTIDALQRSGEAPGPVQLAGYSLGGRIALHYALSRPERVARLVLMGARPGITDLGERISRDARDRTLADRLRADGLEAFIDYWESLPLLAPVKTTLESRRALRNARLNHAPDALAIALEVFSPGQLDDLWPRLDGLAVETVWAAGARDPIYPALMQRAAALTPNGRYVAIPDAGHMVLVDAPEAVAALLRG